MEICGYYRIFPAVPGPTFASQPGWLAVSPESFRLGSHSRHRYGRSRRRGWSSTHAVPFFPPAYKASNFLVAASARSRFAHLIFANRDLTNDNLQEVTRVMKPGSPLEGR